jgi:DNA-binding Lrp family transcriptional regulator
MKMEKNTLKEAELKLVVELMKNSRRSDRELAKATGLSQPTVSRLRMKLEKGGYIKEYTMIPDFEKLGYEILAITFVKLGKNLEPEQIDEARRIAKEDLEKTPFAVVMLERGLGLKYDGVIVAFYEDYVAYSKHMDVLKQYSFLETSEIESFLISLKDTVRYRPLTFKALAEHLLTWKQNKK